MDLITREHAWHALSFAQYNDPRQQLPDNPVTKSVTHLDSMRAVPILVPMLSKDDIHEALMCLYDPAELERTALASTIGLRSGQAGATLRRLLLDAIEALRPAGRVAPSASEFRAHECISMRYLSAMSVEEIADELSLSPRQVYRDLRWGEERLCEILSQRLASQEQDQRADSLADEISTLTISPERVNLAQAVRDAMATIAPLATTRGVGLKFREPDGEAVISATPGVLGEIITQLLSALVQSAHSSDIEVRLDVRGNHIALILPVGAEGELARADLLESALQVAQAQGYAYEFSGADGERCLSLVLPRCGDRRVLVVEDNPAAFALYQRYLANTEWQPTLAPSPRVAGHLVATIRAEAVLLDIMMPETDGWRVLQALKMDERTRDIPVIICSVVDDPALGSALGASAYLTKPLSRPALLQALNQAVRARKLA